MGPRGSHVVYTSNHRVVSLQVNKPALTLTSTVSVSASIPPLSLCIQSVTPGELWQVGLIIGGTRTYQFGDHSDHPARLAGGGHWLTGIHIFLRQSRLP